MLHSLHFGATYAVKGKPENIAAHVAKLETMGIPVRSHASFIDSSGFAKGFIATGEQDVAEFDAKKATTQQPNLDLEYKRDLKALLRNLSVPEFFAIVPTIQKKYEDAKKASPSPEWTIYKNRNLPFRDLEYNPISALNRALEKGKFDPLTGIVASNFDFFEGSIPGEDGQFSYTRESDLQYQPDRIID